MEIKKKNKIIQDMPFYAFIGIIAIGIASVVIYLLWAIFFA